MTNFLSRPKTEKEVLASMMRDIGVYYEAADAGVTSATFTTPIHGEVFRAIARRADLKQVVSLVDLAQDLPDYAVELAEIDGTIATTEPAARWIDELRQCEARRMTKAVLLQTADRIERGDATLEAAANSVDECLAETLAIGGERLRSLIDISAEFEAEYLQDKPPATIPFFPQNTTIGKSLLLRGGEILVVAAGSGVGKTQVAAQAAIEQLKAGLNVLYVCTETTARDIFARLLAPVVGEKHYRLISSLRPQGVVDLFRRCNDAFKSEYQNRLFIAGIDGGSTNVLKLRSLIREAAKKAGKIDVVIVDFIQDFEPLDYRATTNENLSRAMTIISHTVKEYHAAGIILSQCNRREINGDADPNLAWIKDCSKIGELADAVCFLMRDKNDQSKATFICTKARSCPPFNEPLTYENARYVSALYIDPRCAPESVKSC